MRPLLAALLALAAALPAQEYRAFWADAFHSGYKNPLEVDRMVEDVAQARGNAIFIEIRNRGGSYYLHSLEPPAEDSAYAPGFDALEYLIRKAHARGIEVHAWYPVTPLWPFTRPPVDPRHVWHAHGPHAPGDAMWMTADAAGRLSTSVDPGHPEAARYLADVILEPAHHYDLDGLHLDYIRYPEDTDYGWNPTAVSRFQRLENRTGPPDPRDPRWSDFRRRQVTALVRQIYLRAMALKPSLKISAALVTWGNGPASDAAFLSTDACRRVFQDWRSWMEEGILDLGMPMNYFVETRYAAYLDRWLEFEKDRQYRRAMAPGLGIYLNTIPDSLAQTRRVLAPSPAGNRPLGITFYSYASTNILNAAGAPITPNATFYQALADLFGAPAAPPAMPWKSAPSTGHVYGWLHLGSGPGWLADGATVVVESDTGAAVSRRVTTDGGGFFGAADLPPDRYRVRVERAGLEVFRTIAQDIAAGRAIAFEMNLREEDFARALPRLVQASKSAAAPGDVLSLHGAMLAAEPLYASAAPLPAELGATQVVVNGMAAPLFSVAPDRLELQLPFLAAERWTIVVKHAGLESAPLTVAAVEAAPAVLGLRRVADRYLEIYCTGLGPTNPPAVAGTGAAPPFPLLALPAAVWLGELRLNLLYAGLAPYLPGQYQLTVELPAPAATGPLRIQIGSAATTTEIR
ncbi:MAG: family 10 glycosylhydrolase [Acidobacteria bacterium]|nr:family 10 glycosylhydrolase [Acidobacteriota bacterium]